MWWVHASLYIGEQSGQIVQPIKIITVSLLYLVIDALSSDFSSGFNYVLGMSSPKKKSLRWNYFSKISQDGGVKISADESCL